MEGRHYSYVGPIAIRDAVAAAPRGTRVNSQTDIRAYVRRYEPTPVPDPLPLTYVVDLDGDLLIAPRQSEHVACAGGAPVLAAGELFLSPAGPTAWEVIEVSNLSTGYCPEPDCWAHVASALQRAGLDPPISFSWAVTFRRCPQCKERNVVKDAWFVCDVCGADLPSEWNFQDA